MKDQEEKQKKQVQGLQLQTNAYATKLSKEDKAGKNSQDLLKKLQQQHLDDQQEKHEVRTDVVASDRAARREAQKAAEANDIVQRKEKALAEATERNKELHARLERAHTYALSLENAASSAQSKESSAPAASAPVAEAMDDSPPGPDALDDLFGNAAEFHQGPEIHLSQADLLKRCGHISTAAVVAENLVIDLDSVVVHNLDPPAEEPSEEPSDEAIRRAISGSQLVTTTEDAQDEAMEEAGADIAGRPKDVHGLRAESIDLDRVSLSEALPGPGLSEPIATVEPVALKLERPAEGSVASGASKDPPGADMPVPDDIKLCKRTSNRKAKDSRWCGYSRPELEEKWIGDKLQDEVQELWQ